MTGPDLLVLPPSLALLTARPLSPPCQPRQGPRLGLPTTAGACIFLAPVPRLPKFILPNRTGLSCPRRVGEGTTLPWTHERPHKPPPLPRPPDLLRLPTRSLPSSPPHRGAPTRVPRPGTGDSAQTTPHSPAGRGLGLGRGRGAVLPRNGRDRYSAKSRPGRGRRSGEGGTGNW